MMIACCCKMAIYQLNMLNCFLLAGQICGHDICKPGSFCATCEVELCLDKVVEKSGEQNRNKKFLVLLIGIPTVLVL